MAVVDVAGKSLALKIVYYGCALGGKTTNLVTLHRLTDPDGRQGLVSIATNDDRTLFFDLLPMDLGQVGGLAVKVKLYTVPGQVHYELTRRQVLGGADGVVLVFDSDPAAAKSNAWALDNLRFNLKQNGLDPDAVPLVLQWNKRDLPNAQPLDAMVSQLNTRALPAFEAVATSGAGIVDTFATVLELALVATYRKTARSNVTPEQICATLGRALGEARRRQPAIAQARATPAPAPPAATRQHVFDQRFDMDAYRDDEAERGRDRRVVDQETLLSESVQANMMLAEKLDGVRELQAKSERRAEMMQALSRLAPLLVDPAGEALPQGVMASLLGGARRSRGSLLVAGGPGKLVEREVLPAGVDPLNASIAEGLGSVAWRLHETPAPRIIEDLAGEVFFGAVPPEAADLAALGVFPVGCDGIRFGALFVYGAFHEPPIDATELEYWRTAAMLVGLAIHWRALRNKLAARASA